MKLSSITKLLFLSSPLLTHSIQEGLSSHPNSSSSVSQEKEAADSLNTDSTDSFDEEGDVLRAPAPQQQQDQPQRGHWGTPISYDHHIHIGDDTTNTSATLMKQQQDEEQPIPFVALKKKLSSTKESTSDEIDIEVSSFPSGAQAQQPTFDQNLSHSPPSGFTLAAHVITNPRDGKSYFTSPEDSPPDENLLIPFQDCGATGSTTQGISLSKAFFRQFPKSAHPAEFVGAKEKHLLICLNRLEMVLSGGGATNGEEGERRVFKEGSVILMEDLLGKGHKIYSTDGDVSVMMLTLPKENYSTCNRNGTTGSIGSRGGTERKGGRFLSRFGLRRPKQPVKGPCPLEHDPAYSTLCHSEEKGLRRVNVRRALFTLTGFLTSAKSYLALSRSIPLFFSVGVGSLCVVTGGTVGAVLGMERLCDEFETYREKERLRKYIEEDEAVNASDINVEDDVNEEEIILDE